MGSTFADEVFNLNASVLLLIYTPWCGFSRQLQSVFVELGHQLGQENPLVRLARFDHSANDHPPSLNHLNLRGVPRVYLFNPGEKSHPVRYPANDERSKDALKRWLQIEVDGVTEWLDKTASRGSDSQEPLESGLLDPALEEL